MSTPDKPDKRYLLINTIAVFAYLACVIQWLLAFLPYTPALMGSGFFETYVSDPTPRPTAPSANVPMELSGITIVIGIIIVVLLIGVTIISLRRAPKAVGEIGHKVTHSTATAILPIVTHHAKLPPQKRRILTARLEFYCKLALVVVPLLLVLIAPNFPSVPREVINFLAAIAALWTMLLFCLQFGLTKLLRLDPAKTW